MTLADLVIVAGQDLWLVMDMLRYSTELFPNWLQNHEVKSMTNLMQVDGIIELLSIDTHSSLILHVATDENSLGSFPPLNIYATHLGRKNDML